MTPALQAKLLRFLEEKTFKRVGGLADIRVDVRVIAATNRNLEDEVKAGQVPRGPVLPAAGDAGRAAAAARAARRHPAARRLLRRPLQPRVPQARPRRRRRQRWRCSSSTAGPATSASCATPSSARCCCGPRLARARGLRDAVAHAPIAARSGCRPTASNLEEVERQLLVQALERAGGNQTHAGAPARASTAIRCATASRSSGWHEPSVHGDAWRTAGSAGRGAGRLSADAIGTHERHHRAAVRRADRGSATRRAAPRCAWRSAGPARRRAPSS